MSSPIKDSLAPNLIQMKKYLVGSQKTRSQGRQYLAIDDNNKLTSEVREIRSSVKEIMEYFSKIKDQPLELHDKEAVYQIYARITRGYKNKHDKIGPMFQRLFSSSHRRKYQETISLIRSLDPHFTKVGQEIHKTKIVAIRTLLDRPGHPLKNTELQILTKIPIETWNKYQKWWDEIVKQSSETDAFKTTQSILMPDELKSEFNKYLSKKEISRFNKIVNRRLKSKFNVRFNNFQTLDILKRIFDTPLNRREEKFALKIPTTTWEKYEDWLDQEVEDDNNPDIPEELVNEFLMFIPNHPDALKQLARLFEKPLNKQEEGFEKGSMEQLD